VVSENIKEISNEFEKMRNLLNCNLPNIYNRTDIFLKYLDTFQKEFTRATSDFSKLSGFTQNIAFQEFSQSIFILM
jgi:hypothetical protein